MPREQFQTLSEPMYYVLLAFMDECCGIDVMNRVKEISGGRVVVGPGTVYAMLDKFRETLVIREIYGRAKNKRAYIITDQGKALLRKERERLQLLFLDGEKVLGGRL